MSLAQHLCLSWVSGEGTAEVPWMVPGAARAGLPSQQWVLGVSALFSAHCSSLRPLPHHTPGPTAVPQFCQPLNSSFLALTTLPTCRCQDTPGGLGVCHLLLTLCPQQWVGAQYTVGLSERFLSGRMDDGQGPSAGCEEGGQV